MNLVRHSIVAFVVIALLLSRMMGTHLHLCFDGQEAPTSLQSQTNDFTGALHVGNQPTKQDVDIDLLSEILTKTAKIVLDLPVLLIAVALFLLFPRPLPSYGRGIAASLVLTSWPRIRPPLRAPPR